MEKNTITNMTEIGINLNGLIMEGFIPFFRGLDAFVHDLLGEEKDDRPMWVRLADERIAIKNEAKQLQNLILNPLKIALESANKTYDDTEGFRGKFVALPAFASVYDIIEELLFVLSKDYKGAAGHTEDIVAMRLPIRSTFSSKEAFDFVFDTIIQHDLRKNIEEMLLTYYEEAWKEFDWYAILWMIPHTSADVCYKVEDGLYGSADRFPLNFASTVSLFGLLATEVRLSAYDIMNKQYIVSNPYHQIMIGFIEDCAREIQGIRDTSTFTYLQGRDGLVDTCMVCFDIDWLYRTCKQDQNTKRMVITKSSWLAQSICYGNPVLHGAGSQYGTGYIHKVEDLSDDLKDLYLSNMKKFLKLDDSHLSLREVFSVEFLKETKDPQKELNTINRMLQTYYEWFKMFDINSINDTMVTSYLQIQSIWAIKLAAVDGKVDENVIDLMLANYYRELTAIVCFDTSRDYRLVIETMLVGLTQMLPEPLRKRIVDRDYITDHSCYALTHLIMHSRYNTFHVDNTIANIYQMNVLTMLRGWSYGGPENLDELSYLFDYLDAHMNPLDPGFKRDIKLQKLYPWAKLYINSASDTYNTFPALLTPTDPYYYYISILSEL